MKTSLITTIFFLSFYSLSVSAQDFFFCESGSDRNDGKTEQSPFKSVEKLFATFKWMNGGDRVLLCRGGKFEYSGAKKLFNYRCSAEKPCSISDYGDKNSPAPEIRYKGTHSVLWFSDAPKNRADGGYNISNIKLISDQKTGYAIFIADEVNDFHVDNVHVEGFTNRMHDRVSLTNSTIINNSAQGFLGACNDCLIENNLFQNNGYARAIYNHNIYVGSASTARYKNMTIRNNKLYQSAIVDGQCMGTSLTAHGNIDNLIIEDNEIREDKHAVHGHCYGINVAPGYGEKYDESFKNVVIQSDNVEIKNNRIFMVNSSGAALRLGGLNVFQVTENIIWIPDADVIENCFKLTETNANTDMSSNECLSIDGDIEW